MKLKKAASLAISFSLFLSALVPGASAAGAGSRVYANSRQIAGNLTYSRSISYTSETQRQQSHVLTLAGQGDAYPIVMACDTIYGSLSIEKMIAYAESKGKNVLAAVNTDFFSTKTGVPLGIVVEDGVYKSSPEGHTAVAFMQDGGVRFFEKPEVTMTLKNMGSASDQTNSGKTVALTHFNKYRVDSGGLYLFSSAFSTVSTRTSSPGWFVRFKIVEGSPALSGKMSLVVTETFYSDGAVPIGDDCLVLTAATAAGLDGEFSKFKAGDAVTLEFSCSDPELSGARWATGCGDVLIKDGAITDASLWDKEIADERHPRTAFGLRADGSIVVCVVDGRQNGLSLGLTLRELAEEMLSQGCVWAVNMDGGSSSAMAARFPGQESCSVVSSPVNEQSRKCAAYLLFVTDRTSDGVPRILGDGGRELVLLAGSSADLAVAAADGGYRPVPVPSDVKASSGGLGSISGLTYTAGTSPGDDVVQLYSPSTGASGVMTVHIVGTPTSISIADSGGAKLDSLSVWPGDEVQLSPVMSYYGLSVAASPGAYVFSASGDAGTVSDAGAFTAGGMPGAAGSVTLTAGAASVTIPVAVVGFSDVFGHWAKPYIKDLAGLGILKGVSETAFAPDRSVSRGDFVLMLHRAAGSPEPPAPSSFSDVPQEAYFAKAVAWAESCGIAKGDGNGSFFPSATLTREQAFTLVYRALGALGVDFADAPADSLAAFSDSQALSEYAVTPAATLVAMGVVSGSGGWLAPASEMTRAQVAKVLDVLVGKA